VLIESGGTDHEDATADFNRGDIVGHEYHPLEHLAGCVSSAGYDRDLGWPGRRI
jgi:hypothetical protein